MSGFVVFDIETKVLQDTLKFMDDPKPDARLTDEEKIKADIEKKKAKMIEEAALDADFSYVCNIGYKTLDLGKGDSPTEVLCAENPKQEKANLILFWDILRGQGGRCIGYNIISFDLPFLLRRSFAHGIIPETPPSLAKYRDYPTVDLYGLLYNWGPGKGLKWVAKRYGIENKMPEVNGSQVADMSAEERKAYCENDVLMTDALARMMRGIYWLDKPRY